VVLDAVLQLRRGPVEQARAVMASWMTRKNRSQPKRSSGCVFQNLSEADRRRLDLPTTSAGYVIDKYLHLKGYRVGGAKISSAHGNFMVNAGGASAEDFRTLIAEVKRRARDQLGLDLKEEVRYLGFPPP
jgi:UDP-N-acetylmuramate dehydrogenase